MALRRFNTERSKELLRDDWNIINFRAKKLNVFKFILVQFLMENTQILKLVFWIHHGFILNK